MAPLDGASVDSFCDELLKIAMTMPGSPVGLAEIKSTVPNQPLSGRLPKYTKVNSETLPSPAAGNQPVAAPPPVRT